MSKWYTERVLTRIVRCNIEIIIGIKIVARNLFHIFVESICLARNIIRGYQLSKHVQCYLLNVV